MKCKVEGRVLSFLVFRTIAAWLASVLPLLSWGVGPAGLPEITDPPGTSRVDLGKRVFFDPTLSVDGKVSCASCHRPEFAFTDGLPVARGVGGKRGTRNTPSLWNARFSQSFFWDGRRPTLESQVIDPLFSEVEHGLGNADELLEIVRGRPEYVEGFERTFGKSAISIDEFRAALVAYVRSLISGDSSFDRYYYGHDESALSAPALRGLELFRGRAGCTECHLIGEQHALFTDHRFHSLGVGLQEIERKLPMLGKSAKVLDRVVLGQVVATDAEMAALGRFLVSGSPADIGRFKTPSLRNVALTAPYMHDGSIPTLEEAVERELYYGSLSKGRPLVLTAEEKTDLMEFLRSLTSGPIHF